MGLPEWAFLAVLMSLSSLVVAVDATAKPPRAKRGASPREPLDLVVLPFEVLRGDAAGEASQALELELELVDGVRVQDAVVVLADLEAGQGVLDAATVKRVMTRRSLEAIVTAPAGFERPWLMVLGRDGRPRVLKELPRGADADQMAAVALAAVKAAVPSFFQLKPLPLPPRSGDVGLRDILVDGDEDDLDVDERAGKAPTQGKGPERGPRRDKDKGAEASRTTGPQSDRANDTRRGPPRATLTESSTDDEHESGDRSSRRRRTLEDDSGTAPRRSSLDDADRDRLPGADDARRSVDDKDTPAAAPPPPDAHTFAVSGTFDGAWWLYSFEGNGGAQPAPVTAGFHPGGSLRADVWPLPFVGLDASGALSAIPFKINGNEVFSVTPDRFVAWHTNVGASLRGASGRSGSCMGGIA